MSAEHPERRVALERELRAWIAQRRPIQRAESEPSPDESALRALGY